MEIWFAKDEDIKNYKANYCGRFQGYEWRKSLMVASKDWKNFYFKFFVLDCFLFLPFQAYCQHHLSSHKWWHRGLFLRCQKGH